MRPLYVSHDKLTVDRIQHQLDDDESVMSVGDYRMPTPANNLAAVEYSLLLAEKLEREAKRWRADLEALAVRLSRRQARRENAAAYDQPAAAESPIIESTPGDELVVSLLPADDQADEREAVHQAIWNGESAYPAAVIEPDPATVQEAAFRRPDPLTGPAPDVADSRFGRPYQPDRA